MILENDESETSAPADLAGEWLRQRLDRGSCATRPALGSPAPAALASARRINARSPELRATGG